MKLTKERKEAITKEFGGADKNTGLTEVQVAILTERINYLTDHIQSSPKDHHNRRGLINLVNKRKQLLEYLKNTDDNRYHELIKRLNIRK